MPILEIRDVTSGYGDVQILWGTTMSLEKGKLTCLVGGNGVGKTTLLRTTLGLIRPWSGTIFFEGNDVSKLPAHTKAGMGLVLVPEGRQLFSDMTVAENLEMGATNMRARPKIGQNLERVYEMFPRLKERRLQHAGTLSGGEQQMLAAAAAVAASALPAASAATSARRLAWAARAAMAASAGMSWSATSTMPSSRFISPATFQPWAITPTASSRKALAAAAAMAVSASREP